MFQLDHF